MHNAFSSRYLDRDQETASKLIAISPDYVDLVGRIGGVYVPVRASTTGGEVDGHNVALSIRPFALHPKEPPIETQHEIGSSVLRQGVVDLEVQSGGLRGDRQLGGISLAIRIVLHRLSDYTLRLRRKKRAGRMPGLVV